MNKGIIIRFLSFRLSLRRLLSACLVYLFCYTVLANAAEISTNIFRLGFSANTLSGVNENDAMAAVKAWASLMAKERGIPVDSVPRLLNGVNAIAQAIRDKEIDAIASGIDEYWKLRDELDSEVFIASSNDGQSTEKYVLIVHNNSNIRQVEDLRGRSLTLLKSPRMTLASIWLDTTLILAGLPPANKFCRVSQDNKLSKVILLVFFRQTDACIVTQRSLKTMNELNPQMSQQLKIINSSPEFIPSGFFFRRNYNDPIKEKIIKELGKLISTPAGAQILTLFQSGSLDSMPISTLSSEFELLSTHDRLVGGSGISSESGTPGITK